jgi:hypothetical protein
MPDDEHIRCGSLLDGSHRVRKERAAFSREGLGLELEVHGEGLRRRWERIEGLAQGASHFGLVEDLDG